MDPAFSQCSIVGRMDDGGVYSLYRMIGCCSTIDTQTISTQYLHTLVIIGPGQYSIQGGASTGSTSSSADCLADWAATWINIMDTIRVTATSLMYQQQQHYQHHSIIRQVSCPLVSRALVWIEVVLSPALGAAGKMTAANWGYNIMNILNESYWIIPHYGLHALIYLHLQSYLHIH